MLPIPTHQRIVLGKINFIYLKIKMIRRTIIRNITNLKFPRPLTTSLRCFSEAREAENLTHFGFETVKTSEKAEKGKNNKLRLQICCLIEFLYLSSQSLRECRRVIRSNERCHVTWNPPSMERYFC